MCILKFWVKRGTKIKQSNERKNILRVLEAAAAIIKEDIRSVPTENNYYPPMNKTLENLNDEIPDSTNYFLKQVILKNRRSKSSNFNWKCLLAMLLWPQCDQDLCTSTAIGSINIFVPPIGSRHRLAILSSPGTSVSYNNTVKYEVADVPHPQPYILLPENGSLL